MIRITPPLARAARASRRTLYRRLKRTLVERLAQRWRGSRLGLDAIVRRVLRPLSRSEIATLLRDRRAALAMVAATVMTGAAGASPPVDLADVVAGAGGFVINGAASFDESGFSVSGAGDVNGDGLADLIIGGPYAGPATAGESYVVFGKRDTTPVDLAAVIAGSGGFVMRGVNPWDTAGRSVSGAGDVNGDGLDDVIVGSGYANDYTGESYVVFGKADTTPVELSDIVAGIGGFVINGANPYDNAGLAVSGGGDVNGDGLADLIVGARYAGPGNAGETYVVFGKADTAPVNLADVIAGTGGFVINGIDSDDRSGFSVSDAGDVNGDGLDDVVLGALFAEHYYYKPNAGRAFVVFGKADTAPVQLAAVVAGDGGFVMNGYDPNDNAGRSVSGAGDVNGDGLADVIVGASRAFGSNIQAGNSYVVFGTADTAPVNLGNLKFNGKGIFIEGFDGGDQSGRSVSGAGDVNGDGLADVIVGAPFADLSGLTNVGEGHVVLGRADAAPVNLYDVAAGTGGFVMTGLDKSDLTGLSVSGAGDVNGDGFDDVIVAAPSADANGINGSGRCFVVFGHKDVPVTSCAGDINGDGVVDPTDLAILLSQWGPCGPG
ncbi:MAG: FG-GAP repeat protein [Phycisphaerales bacterium]|nr:FG-GAP repeat protein [Phycisphaerales bacterium]